MPYDLQHNDGGDGSMVCTEGCAVFGERPRRDATGGWVWDVERRTAGGNWNAD